MVLMKAQEKKVEKGADLFNLDRKIGWIYLIEVFCLI